MNEEVVMAVSAANFEDAVLQADKPVLLDFWAEWCGPCKAITPILEEIAEGYKGTLVVAKLNVDDNSEIAERYSVRGIPTLLLFKNGEVLAKQVGVLPKSQLTTFIDAHM